LETVRLSPLTAPEEVGLKVSDVFIILFFILPPKAILPAKRIMFFKFKSGHLKDVLISRMNQFYKDMFSLNPFEK